MNLLLYKKQPGLRAMSTLIGETISGTSATFTGGLVMRPIVLVFSISLQQIVIGLTQHGLII